MTDSKTPPPPEPWLIDPKNEPSSLAWRMGAGEEVLAAWLLFVLGLDDETRARYLDASAAPESWRETVRTGLANRRELERIMGIKR